MGKRERRAAIWGTVPAENDMAKELKVATVAAALPCDPLTAGHSLELESATHSLKIGYRARTPVCPRKSY